MRHPLKPETIERISAAQAAAPQNFNMQLEAICLAYRGADHTVAYYSTRFPDPIAKQISAMSRERFSSDLRKLLGFLVLEVSDQEWDNWLAGE